MPLTVVRREGEDDGLVDWLDRAARELVCRAGDEWTLAVEAHPRGLILVVTGPCRSHCGAWAGEPSRGADGTRWRYRRALGSATEWTSDALDAMVRDLVWHPLEIAPNPIQCVDPPLARALERTVLEALRGEPEEPLVIRFGLWNGDDDDPRYVCKVERVPSAAADAPPAWRWWSPLVRTPAELASHLQEAIRSRDRQPPTPRATKERQFWGWGAVGQAGA